MTSILSCDAAICCKISHPSDNALGYSSKEDVISDMFTVIIARNME